MQPKEALAQNLEVTNMVDFKAKIKAQKSKDRKRAGKKAKTPEKDRLPSVAKATIPRQIPKEEKVNSAAIMKGVTDLFKDKDIDYDTYDDIIPEDAFGNLDSFSASGSFGGGIPVTDMSTFMSFKKGGRIKKAGKRKRAALRGQRSELRGS